MAKVIPTKCEKFVTPAAFCPKIVQILLQDDQKTIL
jgi:hypothetical protein